VEEGSLNLVLNATVNCKGKIEVILSRIKTEEERFCDCFQ
jgi:hypothetical protein